MEKEKLSIRLKKALNIRNMKQVDLIEKTGIDKGALSSYISGKYQPKQDKISIISKALDVNELWLMGYDVPMDRNEKYSFENDSTSIFELTEESIEKYPEITKELFKHTGELIFDLSSFTGKKSDIIELSTVLNDSSFPVRSKLAILNSVIELVKFDTKNDELKIYYKFTSEEQTQTESEDNLIILENYKKLNEVGKLEAQKRIEELAMIDKYTKKDD